MVCILLREPFDLDTVFSLKNGQCVAVTSMELKLKEIEDAVPVVREVAFRTPTIRYESLDGDGPYLKMENLQRLGAFKIRGIWNYVSHLDKAQLARGLGISSTGNAGLALAWAARRLGVRCRVTVPEGADEWRVDLIRKQGAEIEYLSTTEIFKVLEEETWRSSPLSFINPIGDPRIQAGVGTVGLEILAEVPDVGTVLVPVGGGDLAAGVAVAVKSRRPETKVLGVQAQGAAVLPEALRTGHAYRMKEPPRTIADNISTPLMLEGTASFLASHLDGCLTVSDDEIMQAIRRLAIEARTVAEPSGAAAFAAWISHHPKLDPPVVAIVSGGNVAPALLAKAIA